MTYKETIAYLYAQLPMYQRIGAAAYKPNLDNTIALLEALGNPQNDLTCIHIAGTNGKGSTSHLFASIFQEADYTVGLYTSPHLIDFRERIKVNGVCIPKKFVAEFTEKHKKVFDKIKPSFFEMTVGLCFQYFKSKKVDIAIIETGLGGRLDSTNVIHPILSVITNISFDHQHLLGDTLEKIAFEKAGIIKPKTPVVIGERKAPSAKVFIKKAKQERSPIYFADDDIQVKGLEMIYTHQQLIRQYSVQTKELDYYVKSELCGNYQSKNISTVLKSMDLLNAIHSKFIIDKKNIRKGIEKVVSNTGLMGRWQRILKRPISICDTAHNPAGILEITKQLKSIPHDQLHFVIGMVNDKDSHEVLKLLPKNAMYYFTKAKVPRALDEIELMVQAKSHRLNGYCYTTVEKAFTAARKRAFPNDLIFIGGSTFVVADLLKVIKKNPPELSEGFLIY